MAHVDPASSQRIDRFLWYARLAGNRSAAQALAERGIVRLNGRRIERAHAPVRRGDLLTLPLGHAVRVIRVLELPSRRGPAPEAQALYEFIETGESAATPPPSPIDIDAGAGEE
ncbi:MAG: RNA-binding S4 domain-containing protein [Sphingobium sp.]